MALSEISQALRLIERAQKVMLVVPQASGADALASMMAFYLVLDNVKEGGVDEISVNHVPANLQFLPGSSQILTEPDTKPEVVVDITGSDNLSSVRTETTTGGLRVHLQLQNNREVTQDDITTVVHTMPYDLVVTFGAADIEALGQVFVDHTDFFYQTPTINIDNSAGNEHFGTVNLVDITAGSIAEVAYLLIAKLIGDELDSNLATTLYAGIIAGTDSFQKAGTTPKSFQLAAKLMEAKAERELVIQHLVKTKPLALLKLSGRLYARLRYHEPAKLFWSIVREVDFKESGASHADLPEALQELSHNIAGFSLAFVLHEKSHGSYEVISLLGSGLATNQDQIQQQMQAKEDRGLLRRELKADSLEQAETDTLNLIHNILPAYNGGSEQAVQI